MPAETQVRQTAQFARIARRPNGTFKLAGFVLASCLAALDASAAVLFSESFTGYTGTNSPPAGWVNFNDLGIGADSSQSSFWLTSGNQTGISPEGDLYYVRVAVTASTGEGLARSITGLVVGQQYTVSFYNAASTAFGGTDARWDVFLDTTLIGSSAIASAATGIWQSNSLTFTAATTTHQIGFRGRGFQNSLLDLVVISDSVPVPEPASFSLLGAGLLGGFVLRSRNRSRSAGRS